MPSTPAHARHGVFISYRRDDSAGEAGRLADHLARLLGDEAVFFDVQSIAGGDDWRNRIDAALDACDTMLVVVGRRWLDLRCARRPHLRRLDDPRDMVAWEIARGLDRGLRLIVVQVQGSTPMPPQELPPRIAALAMRQSHALRHETFSADVASLATQIRRTRQARRTRAAQWQASDLTTWARPLDTGPEAVDAAIAVVSALELLMARSGAPRRLSVRYLYEKARRQQRGDRAEIDGLYMLPVLYVASFFGVPDDRVWPFVPGARALPAGTRWSQLERRLGPCVRGEFYRVPGISEAIAQLAAGRPVVALCRVSGESWFKARQGEIPMPAARETDYGVHVVVLVGFDPVQARFSFLNTWGRAWGRKGFGSFTLAVAREVLEAEGLWSVELSSQTVAELVEARAQASAMAAAAP